MYNLNRTHIQHLKNEKTQSASCVFYHINKMLLCLRPYNVVTLNFLYKVKIDQYILKITYLNS